MSEIYTTETILLYLDGEMPADEMVAFEAAMRKDTNLKEEVEQLRVAIGAVQLAGAGHKVRRIHTEMSMQPGKARTIPLFPRGLMRIAAAAAVVLVLAASWFYTVSSTDNIVDEHFISLNLDASRSGNRFTPLQEAFNKGDHAAVIHAANAGQLSGHDSLLVAMSYYNTGRFDDAGIWLEALRTSALYHGDADYYLAFTYLREGKRGEALDIFRKIHDDPDHLYHSSVTGSMLRKLEFRNR